MSSIVEDKKSFSPLLVFPLEGFTMAQYRKSVQNRFHAFYTAMLVCLLLSPLLAACSGTTNQNQSSNSDIHKIKHVIVIMQENRSFDTYFGTFPGADGIPMKNGVPTVCVPQASGPCVRPYRDTQDRNRGGPHNFGAAKTDINGGKMDGFLT